VKIVPGDPPAATVYKLGATLAPWNVAPDQQGNVWFIGSPDTGPALVGRLAGVLAGAQPPPTGGGGGTPSPAPPTTILQPSATAVAKVSNPQVKADTITANQICVGPPEARCSLVYLVQTHEYVTGFPTMAKPKKPLTIGRLSVTLTGGQSRKVTIKLNAKGRKLLKKLRKLRSTFTVTQSINGGKPKTILKKTVTFRRGGTR
jgi:hypothetical protein